MLKTNTLRPVTPIWRVLGICLQAEKALKASGLDYTIVRCASYTTNVALSDFWRKSDLIGLCLDLEEWSVLEMSSSTPTTSRCVSTRRWKMKDERMIRIVMWLWLFSAMRKMDYRKVSCLEGRWQSSSPQRFQTFLSRCKTSPLTSPNTTSG